MQRDLTQDDLEPGDRLSLPRGTTMKKRWIVRATRTLHGNHFATYHLGPFRYKAWARLVAWLETISGGTGKGWAQSCEVVSADTVPADVRTTVGDW